MNTIDDRISAALHAQAHLLTEDDLSPAAPPSSHWTRSERSRWMAPLLAAAVVGAVAAGTITAVQVSRSNSAGPTTPPIGSVQPLPSSVAPTPTQSAPSPSEVSPTPAPSSTGPDPSQSPSQTGPSATASVPSGSPTGTPSQSPPGVYERYQPLWPFGSYWAAEQWRTKGAGSQPWHLDPEQTALNFTRSYLGFTELDQVIKTFFDDLGAHVGIGYRDPNGVQRTAATLHLVQFGTSDDSPWEVVGSDDTTMSLEQPAYGSKVSSPMTIGGHITGVDENITVSLLRLTSTGADRATLAKAPAGGDRAPWTTGPVSFTQRGVLTIVASTGGHLQQVERFAIHGVHT
ncbi:MAG: hypothetical protein ABIQ09_04525 [Jatrophihabitantaceae bacterium]